MTDNPQDPDRFEAIHDEAAQREARIIDDAKRRIQGVIAGEMELMLPELRSLRSEAGATFWNEMRDLITQFTAAIEQDRDRFGALWQDMTAELEHLATLRERIVALTEGDRHVH